MMDKNKTGILFFVGSETFFFISLFIAYIYYALPQADLSVKYLDFRVTLIYTFFLLTSSLTMALAAGGIRKNNRKMVIFFLGITFLFGLIFIFGQGQEYLRLFRLNMTISSGVFGSSFFTLTGFHGLHVIIGLFLILLVITITLTGKLKKIESVFFESVSVYWHFVDVVWVFVFTVAYIIPILIK